MSEWQPIETAPKDGTRVLLGIADDGQDTPGVVSAGWWAHGYGDAPDEMGQDEGWQDFDGEFHPGRSFGAEAYRHKGFQPTHWMPLPQPPKD